jgi:hypothetical protein
MAIDEDVRSGIDNRPFPSVLPATSLNDYHGTVPGDSLVLQGLQVLVNAGDR